jgi:hypothetical protein
VRKTGRPSENHGDGLGRDKPRITYHAFPGMDLSERVVKLVHPYIFNIFWSNSREEEHEEVHLFACRLHTRKGH